MDQDTHFNDGVVSEIKKRIEAMDCSNVGIVTPWHKTRLKTKKSKEAAAANVAETVSNKAEEVSEEKAIKTSPPLSF